MDNGRKIRRGFTRKRWSNDQLMADGSHLRDSVPEQCLRLPAALHCDFLSGRSGQNLPSLRQYLFWKFWNPCREATCIVWEGGGPPAIHAEFLLTKGGTT